MKKEPVNTSFSFILTIDEFRRKFPKDMCPTWIKLTTITMVSSFNKEIPIEKMKTFFENGPLTLNSNCNFEISLKPTTFYNQITLMYKDSFSTKSIKIFPNGSIQVAGCTDLINCSHIIKMLETILKKFDKDILPPSSSFRVVMINSNFSLNYNINLVSTAEHFKSYGDVFKVSFEPDRYSAVKVKFQPSIDMKEVTVSIFSTGKIIITGAETLKEIAFAYNIINHHINEKPDLRVGEVENKESFDIFSGYKITDMVKKVRELGYTSWVKTIDNRQINF